MKRTLRTGVAGALLLALCACGGDPTGTPDGGGSATSDGGGNTGGDTTAPTLIATVPASGSTDIDVGIPIAAEFSEAMDPASVQLALTPAVPLGTPTWSFGDTLLTVTPAAPLAYDTSYTVQLTAGTDRAGNPLAPVSFNFTTGPVPDDTPPSIVSTTPAAAAAGVPTSTRISITFSRPMDVGTVTVDASPSYEFGEASWDSNNRTVTFGAPPADLAAATSYTITVEGQDTSDRALVGTKTFSFTTAAPPDTTPPTVISNSPPSGATGVPVSTSVSFSFSEGMDTASVAGALSIAPAVPCTQLWDASARLMTCNPAADLQYQTTYTVTLSTAAQDQNKIALAAPHTFSFTTAAAADTTRPTITSTSPANGSVGASRTTNISVTFSEAMDKSSAQAAFSITSPSGYDGGTFSWNAAGTVMTYNPPLTFPYGTFVSWQVSTVAQDLAGNALAATQLHSFRVIRSTTTYLYATASLDGFVTDSGNASTTSNPMTVGDIGFSSINYGYRGFLSFDLSGLPTSLTLITSASLRVVQSAVSGTPYGISSSNLGYLYAESVDYGSTLGATDYAITGLGNSYSLSTSAINGTKTALVSTKVRDDWTNRTARGNRSQFRLKWSIRDKTVDGASDSVSIYTGESADLSSRPRLSVTYQYP